MTDDERQQLLCEILFEMHKNQWFLYRAIEMLYADSDDARLVYIRESIAKSSEMWEQLRTPNEKL